MTEKIGLFYGSSTCYTEMAAEKIRDGFTSGAVELFNIENTPITAINNYHKLIFGIPTWDYGELQEDWESIWDELDSIDFSGKTVALYGLGDQIGYPEWFQDALGYLWAKVINLGAQTIGQWPNQGYSYTQSRALTPDGQFFVGLSLDDENDFALSEQRINQWCKQLQTEFNASL